MGAIDCLIPATALVCQKKMVLEGKVLFVEHKGHDTLPLFQVRR